MKRTGHVWEEIVSFSNLLRAARRAARGKGDRRAVAWYLERVELEVLALGRDLEAGTYRPGEPIRFKIHDPKERVITAAPFRDRVVHHAFLGPLEGVLERRMRPESFACRRGKGTHAALRQARRLLRRHGYFLKLDIERCFESIRHSVVMETLERTLKDARALELARVILGGPEHGPPGEIGLPIGSLTSQWFANLVLDRLDHFVTEELRSGSYVRYMDDFVLFGQDKTELRSKLELVREFVETRLQLRLKERATLLAPASEGLPFLGFRLYRGLIRVRPENLRRSRARLRARERAHARGELGEEELSRSVRSVVAHLATANTLSLRRRWFSTRD